MISLTYATELKLLKEYNHIAGIDEVGRGPLAGPVVSAVVILNPEKIGKYRSKTKWWANVRDSKAMTAVGREQVQEFIKQNSLDWAIGAVSHEEIDDLNIHHASLLSMKRAIESLKIKPEVVLIDGRFMIYDLRFMNQKPIIDGDAKILSIATASILAKEYRDDLMRKFSLKYPHYGFEMHKGYDTSFHRKQLFKHGPCEIHRMSFETVKSAISERFRKMIE